MGCSPWGHKELDTTEPLHFIKVGSGWWLVQPLFADMAGNLYHSLSSSLSFAHLFGCTYWILWEERPGNAGCQGQPQAHRSGAKGRQETKNGREHLAQM